MAVSQATEEEVEAVLEAVLTELTRRRVTVKPEGGYLLLLPKERITPHLVALVRDHKSELLELFAGSEAGEAEKARRASRAEDRHRDVQTRPAKGRTRRTQPQPLASRKTSPFVFGIQRFLVHDIMLVIVVNVASMR